MKLSLLTLTREHEATLSEILGEFEAVYPASIKTRATMQKYFRERAESKKNSETHQYVLLTEGQHSSPIHTWMMKALEEAGLGTVNQDIHLVPAPLQRATCGAGRFLTPMPFLSTSTYDNMNKIFAESYEMSNPKGDLDPELDPGSRHPPAGEPHVATLRGP